MLQEKEWRGEKACVVDSESSKVGWGYELVETWSWQRMVGGAVG